LAALERELGSRLLDRRRTGIELTAAGRTLVAQAEKLDIGICELERRVRGADERLEGSVIVSGGELILGDLIVPLLPRFRSQCPGIDFDFRITNEALGNRHANEDVAIRLSRTTEPSLVERKVATMACAVYAAPSFLERAGYFSRGAKLDGLDLVTSDSHDGEGEWLAKRAPNSHIVLRTNSLHSVLGAVRAGVGAALLACVFAEKEPGLEQVLSAAEFPPYTVRLVVHQELRKTRRIRAVLSFLSEAFAQLQPKLDRRDDRGLGISKGANYRALGPVTHSTL
jgi:DNA-binding transcriptional LysR family regulator